MENLRSNEERSRIAMVVIWILLGIEIISLVSDYFQYELLNSTKNGSSLPMVVAEANDLRQQVIAIINLIVYIISGVTFIQWFRRAYFNLGTKVNNLNHSEGWAAGGWFVPFVNLYRPYEIMKELYQETDFLLTKKSEFSFTGIKTTLLGWWWALWIISGIVGQVVFRFSREAESVDDLIVSTQLSIFGSIVFIPLSLVTIKVIKDYSTIEPLLYELKDDDLQEMSQDIV